MGWLKPKTLTEYVWKLTLGVIGSLLMVGVIGGLRFAFSLCLANLAISLPSLSLDEIFLTAFGNLSLEWVSSFDLIHYFKDLNHVPQGIMWMALVATTFVLAGIMGLIYGFHFVMSKVVQFRL
jgi:hypothetical protein